MSDHPESAIRALIVASALFAPYHAWAQPFQAPELPAHLRATPPAHVPQPFPEDGDLELQGGGTSGWVVGAGLLGAGSAVAAVVALGAQARLGAENATPEQVASSTKTRNTAAYVAGASLGGAGVCLVLNRVW